MSQKKGQGKKENGRDGEKEIIYLPFFLVSLSNDILGLHQPFHLFHSGSHLALLFPNMVSLASEFSITKPLLLKLLTRHIVPSFKVLAG